MKISRESNLVLNRVLNDYLPPVLRDRRWFGQIITRLLYKDKAPIYMGFHERVYEMSDAEFAGVYREIATTGLERPTDLNNACIELIRKNVVGETLLEVGSGRGYLSNLLSAQHRVTACDVVIPQAVEAAYPNVKFVESPAESLPFPDASFDTVVSTHMLEHVRDLPRVLAELRRVAAKRLIIVVPCERPHFYTPNLHLHFFPYRYSLLLAFKPKQGTYQLEKAGGDWFYVEDITPSQH